MSESMREDFEAKFKELLGDMASGMFLKVSGDYVDDRMTFAWIAWQASRAALCVELPHFEQYDDDMISGAATAINDCQDAIHAAGVKTQ